MSGREDVRQQASAFWSQSGPPISRDGSQIAFIASYDGSVDLYVTPSGGGSGSSI